VGYALRSALSECKNCRIYSGRQDSGGYKVGLSKEGMTMRWMVFGGLEAIAVWSRLRIAGKGESLLGVKGINVMLVMEGWASRLVRSKA
jgi:hypothetical protein